MAYTTIAAVRDEGITVSMASDAKITTYINRWEPVLERMCGQWFESRAATVTFDGDGSDTFFSEVPIISVTSLKLDDNATALNPDYYSVANNRTDFPDDRRNPMIALKEGYRFALGRRNHEIVGTWGFTEADDSAPQAIQWAATKLVIEKLLTPILPNALLPTPSGPGQSQGAIIEEETDDHKTKWAAPNLAKISRKASPWSGITEDEEIIEIVRMYQAPLAIASPSDWNFPAGPLPAPDIFSDPV